MINLIDLGLDPDNKLWVRDADGQKYHVVVTQINGIDVMSLAKTGELTIHQSLESMPVHAEIQ